MGLPLAANAYYQEDELVDELGFSRRWLRRVVKAHGRKNGQRTYHGQSILSCLIPIAPTSPESEQVVYFLHCPEARRIKIGTSTQLENRIEAIQACSPLLLVLLGVIPGGESLEAEMHERFSHLRVHGEWFDEDESLLAFIQSLRTA